MHKSNSLQLILQVLNIGTPNIGAAGGEEKPENLLAAPAHTTKAPLALGDKLTRLKQMDKNTFPGKWTPPNISLRTEFFIP